MKISSSIKLVAGIAMLAPLAMYAGDGTAADLTLLNNLYATVKTAVGGPIKGLLIAAELVTGIWLYKSQKEPAILLGTPIVMAVTALGVGAM